MVCEEAESRRKARKTERMRVNAFSVFCIERKKKEKERV